MRYAVSETPPKSTITFDASLRGTILLTSGDLTIAKDLTIRGPGAGILSISGSKSGYLIRVLKGFSVTISGLTFKDSKTSSSGFIDNEGTLTLNNSTVSDNTGGGIDNSGTLTLTNSTVSGNKDGGGIYNVPPQSTLTMSNSTVSGNMGGLGGGISNFGGTLTLNNSTVSGNTATGGTLTMSNSTVCGNTATDGDGGGIFNLNSTLTVSNSTVSGNKSSGNGGGIFIQSRVDPGQSNASIAHVDLTFSTIYGNTAHGGGDIAIEDFAIGTSEAIKQVSQVKIRNSIVTGDPAHPGPDIVGMLTSYGYDLFQDNSGATFDPATSTQHGTDKTL